jgi:hypothetical protein
MNACSVAKIMKLGEDKKAAMTDGLLLPFWTRQAAEAVGSRLSW